MTFQKVNYEDLPSTSGVYILEIKNGKKYIGQTKNLRKRLREHFNHICRGDSRARWYKSAQKTLKSQGDTKEKQLSLCSFWVYETDSLEYYEEEFLKSIVENILKKEYYNYWYGSQAELEKKKRQEKIRRQEIQTKEKDIIYW